VAVSRRPPISLCTMVARTHMYTYDATVWDLSIVQGPFSVAPFLPSVTIRNVCIAVLMMSRLGHFVRTGIGVLFAGVGVGAQRQRL
jgi:hypothetical protein